MYSSGKAIQDGLRKEKEKEIENEEAVLKAIEQETYPKSDDNLIARKAIIDKVEKLFSKPYDYHLIVGEHGTGKTTVIRQAADKVGKGIVYIQGYDELTDFSNAFANVLGWNYDITVKKNLGPRDKLYRTMDAFRRLAARYKGKMMTINDLRAITNDLNITQELLQANIFSLNVVDGTVTFQLHLVEMYVMENVKELGLEFGLE
ncbi:hypothetical protein BC937DRAFT_94747 [Endogone sp. FLAS-F59071]|nr:hypothetical protein BC937DRAFT_94747 [Endogone sp. FLAS-F59071]|eukprot:RUS13807.1 hypothetical protein BC937DRAFT_94747 [Endogone sp. FLAS-F59071]